MQQVLRGVCLNTKRLDYVVGHSLSWVRLNAVCSGSFLQVDCPPSPSADAITALCGSNPDVLVVKEMPLSRAVVLMLPSSVKLICEAGTGFNNIDLDACNERGIKVANVADYSSDSVATLVMTAVLNFSASIIPIAGRQSPEDFRVPGVQMPLFELKGKTLGLVGGNGTIGRKVTKLAKAFGLEVLVTSRSGSSSEGQRAVSMDYLLSQSDFVSLHCPLTPQTTKLMSSEQFKLMKPTAYLVNTARGAIVDERALIGALEGKEIAGAFLDVQVNEPPPLGDPLYTTGNLFMTPHIGWQRQEARQRVLDLVADNIESFFSPDKEDMNIVN